MLRWAWLLAPFPTDRWVYSCAQTSIIVSTNQCSAAQTSIVVSTNQHRCAQTSTVVHKLVKLCTNQCSCTQTSIIVSTTPVYWSAQHVAQNVIRQFDGWFLWGHWVNTVHWTAVHKPVSDYERGHSKLSAMDHYCWVVNNHWLLPIPPFGRSCWSNKISDWYLPIL